MSFAQNPVQRDSQALTIIAKTIEAGGGQELLASIRDFTETGTITYNSSDQVTGTVTVKAHGLGQLRIEADLSTGKRTTVISDEGSTLKEENGRMRPIHSQSDGDVGGLTLPYQPLINAIQDTSCGIVFGGIVTHNGVSTYDIRLLKPDSKRHELDAGPGTREGRHFYIDPNTLLVTAVTDRFQYGGRRNEDVPHEVRYSTYQSKNGIATPLTITEIVRDTVSFTMNFSQVTFNSGLAATDFAQ
jgi:hypothetical protein